MEWKLANERLLYARFKRTIVNMNLLQCYARTNNAEEVENISHHNLVIVMGDMNATLERENVGHERRMRYHGCGTGSDDGERPIDLCGLKLWICNIPT